ncbi:MAG: hypothetical protein VKK43_11230 [Synechococcaceae cyanobacterium]|nr:hypothetical protein [Synechococcaceae cyanobacterium]
MAVVSTELLARQARLLADMIETLPSCLAPVDQHARCQQLLGQLGWALERLPAAALASGAGLPGSW